MLFLSIALFFVLGVEDLVFLHRRFFYRLAQFLIFLLLFIVFFGTSSSGFFLLRNGLLFFYTAWLSSEAFKFLIPEISRRKSILYGIVLGLIVIETSWAIALLPIYFVGAAIALNAIVFIFCDIFFTHVVSRVLVSRILYYLGLVILIAILIGFQSFP
jgi:hypothetical protein